MKYIKKTNPLKGGRKKKSILDRTPEELALRKVLESGLINFAELSRLTWPNHAGRIRTVLTRKLDAITMHPDDVRDIRNQLELVIQPLYLDGQPHPQRRYCLYDEDGRGQEPSCTCTDEEARECEHNI